MGNVQTVLPTSVGTNSSTPSGTYSTAPQNYTPNNSISKCPDAPSDGALSSPTFYSDSFDRFTTKGSIQTAGKNVPLFNESVGSLQSRGLFIKKEDFAKLVSILVSEASGKTIEIKDSVLKPQLQNKTNQLITHLELEYCFYYRSYSKLLSLYFSLMEIPESSWNTQSTQSSLTVPNGLMSSSLVVSTQKQEVLSNISNHLGALNTKLTAITTLNVSISNTLNSMIHDYRQSVTGDESVNGSTAKLDAAVASLQASNPSVAIGQLETNRRSVQYTQEKNRYASIYLGLYAFLNISALAVILHIANSK